MNNKLDSLKNLVKRNQSAIVLGAITIPVILLQGRGLNKLNDFLKENNLFEKYYYPEEI